MTRIVLICLFLFSQSLFSVYGQDTSIRIFEGSWLGRISVNSLSLRIVFNLSVTGRDSLIAAMDSPDQGAKNIRLGPVTAEGNKIKISAGALLAEYNGFLKNDTLIEGTWTQAGREFPLDLKKLSGSFTINRPQEPKPPFPYKTEEVKFKNSLHNINIAGTLTMPEGKGPFPAVILVTGSGAQNRDEEIMGHKPFMVIADYLTRNGIAVLRYDDRGVGGSEGNYAEATSADLAQDAIASFNYLNERPEIMKEMTGIAGHSEGGLIAAIAASSEKRVAFVISIAGTGVTGEEVLHRQNRDISSVASMTPEQIEDNISINKKLFAVLKKEKDNQKAEQKIEAVYRRILNKSGISNEEEIEKNLNQLKASFPKTTYNWLRYFIMTDPALFWKKVKCPVLAINGEKDLQVSADMNLPAIEKALKKGGNNAVTTIKIPGLNHLFQTSRTGAPSEYGEIEETFSPEALRIIKDWIADLVKSQPAF
ncbi:MAG: alpha/beta hydrolase [Bacteroidales bacterium]|nr:alpha/beta hydrolase [Bacteroidales bacterium]